MTIHRDAHGADASQRIGGPAFIAAGVLFLTSVFFPRPDDPADHAAFLELLVENAALTQAILLTVPLGIWALVVGVAGIQRSIVGGTGASLARLGLYGVVGGAAVATVQFALASGAVSEGAAGETGVALLAAATYVRSFGMLVMWLALATVGVGILASALYPAWSGWVVIVVGVAMVGVNLLTIVAGATLTTTIISGGLAALTALWAIAIGIWITSRAVHQQSMVGGADVRTGDAT
jgi:hypothetical protein